MAAPAIRATRDRLSGCGCCSCDFFSAVWCAVGSDELVDPDGVDLIDGKYIIRSELPEQDWTVVISFPGIRLPDSGSYFQSGGYYYTYYGICGEPGSEWEGGIMRHTIQLINAADETVLQVVLNVTYSVDGVVDNVRLLIGDGTAVDFEAVVVSNFELDNFGGRYLPPMTITRRETLTNITAHDDWYLIDPAEDGETFESHVISEGLYTATEGIGTGPFRLTFETETIDGNGAAVGEWSVTATAIADVNEGLKLDCPDPRICSVNDSSYSSPQWTGIVSVSQLPMNANEWTRTWWECRGAYAPSPRTNFDWLDDATPSQIGRWLGDFWGKLETGFDGGIEITEGMTPYETTQTYTLEFTPSLVSVVLPHPTDNTKRIVEATMTIPNKGYSMCQDGYYTYQYVYGYDYSYGCNDESPNPLLEYVTFIHGGPSMDFDPYQTTLPWFGWEPPIAEQFPGDELRFINPVPQFRYTTNEFGDAIFKEIFAGPFGTESPAPEGLTISAASETYPYWDPVYCAHNPTVPVLDYTITVKWSKTVDAWDGEPPEVAFTSEDIVDTPGIVHLHLSRTVSYLGTSVATWKTYSAIGGPHFDDKEQPAFRYLVSWSHVDIDLNEATCTLTPATGPMSQPTEPV